MGEVAKMNQELDAAEAQLAEEGRLAEDNEGMKLRHKAFQDQKADKAKGAAIDEIRRSNEYAAAFVKALRNGVKVNKCGAWRATSLWPRP